MQPRRDPEVDGDTILWRRLTSPDWIVPKSDGLRRVSSAAFKGRPEEIHLSVHIADFTDLDTIFSTLPWCESVAEIRAEYFQSLGRQVHHTPDPETDDNSHASITLAGNYGQRKKDAKVVAMKARLIEKREVPPT